MKQRVIHNYQAKGTFAHQRGLSLVELMVSLVVGLILIYGVIEIYVNSKGTYRVNEEMARMQESARFAFDLMVPTVRQAGYTGCVAMNNGAPRDIRKTPKDDFTLTTVLGGHEATSATAWSPALGFVGVEGYTDVISVQSTVSCGANLTGNLTNFKANVQISATNTCDFAKNDDILISDCSSAELFRATNVSKGGAKVTIAHAKSVTGNTENFFETLFGEDAELLKPTSTTYYIGTGASGVPALFSRNNLAASTAELVEGIEGMQILYGVDTDTAADGVVDRYVKANEIPVSGHNWDRVISVRISLLMRSINPVSTKSGSYTFQDVPSAHGYGPDRYIRQEYTHTVQLRNRGLLP